MSVKLVIVGAITLTYLAFLWWYGGRSSPMTEDETDELIRRIRQAADDRPKTEPEILVQFRTLCAQDDGRAFSVVNLLRFRERAEYPPGVDFGDDALAANRRYNRAIVPLLLKHGGHPILDARVQGRLIHPAMGADWDRVGIVRYRSRRDMLKMAADVAGKHVDIHKWAALEGTQVFPVEPGFSLVLVRSLVGLSLLAVSLVILLA